MDVALTRYAIILGYVVETVFVRFISVLFQIIVAYTLIFALDLELTGAVVALIVTEIGVTLGMCAVLHTYGALKDVIGSCNYELFRGWGALLRLGAPGIVMIVAESLFIELTILMLSSGDIDHYDAFLQLLQYHQFYFHLYHGFTTAGAIITGTVA